MESATLLVRAGEPLGEWSGEPGGWRSRWPYPHEVADAAGDHFTMVGERGPTSARPCTNGWPDEISEAGRAPCPWPAPSTPYRSEKNCPTGTQDGSMTTWTTQ